MYMLDPVLYSKNIFSTLHSLSTLSLFMNQVRCLRSVQYWMGSVKLVLNGIVRSSLFQSLTQAKCITNNKGIIFEDENAYIKPQGILRHTVTSYMIFPEEVSPLL